MLTRLFRKRGTGQGPVVESTPQRDPFDFNAPLSTQDQAYVAWKASQAVQDSAKNDANIREREGLKMRRREEPNNPKWKD
jgi:hypothetical protein